MHNWTAEEVARWDAEHLTVEQLAARERAYAEGRTWHPDDDYEEEDDD